MKKKTSIPQDFKKTWKNHFPKLCNQTKVNNFYIKMPKSATYSRDQQKNSIKISNYYNCQKLTNKHMIQYKNSVSLKMNSPTHNGRPKNSRKIQKMLLIICQSQKPIPRTDKKTLQNYLIIIITQSQQPN